MRYDSDMIRGTLGATVFGVSSALVVAVACGGSKPAAKEPIGNNTTDGAGSALAAEPDLPDGVTDGALWTCQISDYDPQPCKFHKEGNDWQLTKLLGSQRFTGGITFGEEGMHFVGQFFCPWGACDEAMDLTFKRGDKRYEAEFQGDVVGVEWNGALADEWGGAGYGDLTGREVD
jgi:hypothetical protein